MKPVGIGLLANSSISRVVRQERGECNIVSRLESVRLVKGVGHRASCYLLNVNVNYMFRVKWQFHDRVGAFQLLERSIFHHVVGKDG